MRVGKNKRLKWCSTNDCDNVIKRPGCCCKKKTLCTTCGAYTCFKCGKPEHKGRCAVDQDKLVLDGTLARYLLVAECINCKVPITKNGACNHMTCSRCRAEFCWICRKDWKSHPRHGPYDISFTVGCDFLLGDTALIWLLVMILFLLFSPIWTLIEVSIAVGYTLKKYVFTE